VLRKAWGVVIGVAERIWKNDSVKSLNGYWNVLKNKWSLSCVISNSRDLVTHIWLLMNSSPTTLMGPIVLNANGYKKVIIIIIIIIIISISISQLLHFINWMVFKYLQLSYQSLLCRSVSVWCLFSYCDILCSCSCSKKVFVCIVSYSLCSTSDLVFLATSVQPNTIWPIIMPVRQSNQSEPFSQCTLYSVQVTVRRCTDTFQSESVSVHCTVCR